MGERYNTDAFYPSVFFAFIWQSPFWRIFTLVLVLMEHPSGISAGLSKTLEMFLGLLRSSLTPSDLSSGFRPPHWPCLVTHRLLVPGQLQGLILKWRPVVWVGGVQGHSGRRMRTGPLLLLSRGQLWFGKQFDGACYSSFRGVSHSIFQTPHSHAEKSWHFWQSIIVSLFLRWCCGLFISDFTSLSERLLLCLESSTTTACTDIKKKSWNIRAFRCASPSVHRTEQCMPWH